MWAHGKQSLCVLVDWVLTFLGKMDPDAARTPGRPFGDVYAAKKPPRDGGGASATVVDGCKGVVSGRVRPSSGKHRTWFVAVCLRNTGVAPASRVPWRGPRVWLHSGHTGRSPASVRTHCPHQQSAKAYNASADGRAWYEGHRSRSRGPTWSHSPRKASHPKLGECLPQRRLPSFAPRRHERDGKRRIRIWACSTLDAAFLSLDCIPRLLRVLPVRLNGHAQDAAGFGYS